MFKVFEKCSFILLIFVSFFSFSVEAKRTPSPNGVYQPEILNKVIQRVTESAAAGSKPVVLFDLDETLINSRTRVLRILRHFASLKKVQREYPLQSRIILQKTQGKKRIENCSLALEGYGLYPHETLKELNAYSEGFYNEIKESYPDLYLSNAFCADDLPMPGAVSYVRSVYKAGAVIVYITGRNRPGMGLCTEENLIRSGFPHVGMSNVLLVMKPNREVDDTAFKKNAIDTLRQPGSLQGIAYGEVVATFENEPGNLNVFNEAFPNGIHVFVDSMHSNRPDIPFAGAPYIRDFLKK